MGRTDKERQAERSNIGAAFEQEVVRKLKSLLEQAGLDETFTIRHHGRHEYMTITVRPEMQHQLRLRKALVNIKPDITILWKDTQIVAAMCGCKRSLKDRGSQDERHSLYMRASTTMAEVLWIEIFDREREKDSREQINRSQQIAQERYPAIDAVIVPSQVWDVLILRLKELANAPRAPSP